VFNKFPLQKKSLDRGGSYNSGLFNVYAKRWDQTHNPLTPNMIVHLTPPTQTQWQIRIVAVNGDGIRPKMRTTLVWCLGQISEPLKRRYSVGILADSDHNYEASRALSRQRWATSKSTGPSSWQVGTVQTKTWLTAIKPRVGIISTGNGPTAIPTENV